MPCDYRLYPRNWKEIRARILERAGHRCEWCSLDNYSLVVFEHHAMLRDNVPYTFADRPKRVVLTIMHLDHNPNHNDDANLMAACQWCHLSYDLEHHQRNAARTRARKRAAGTMPMEMIA